MPEFKPYSEDKLLVINKIDNGKIVDQLRIWRVIFPDLTRCNPVWKTKPPVCGNYPDCKPVWGIDSNIKFVTYCIGCQNWEPGHHYDEVK